MLTYISTDLAVADVNLHFHHELKGGRHDLWHWVEKALVWDVNGYDTQALLTTIFELNNQLNFDLLRSSACNLSK